MTSGTTTGILPQFDLDLSLSGLEIAQRWVETGLVAGFVGTLGVTPLSAERGQMRFACRPGSHLANFTGTIHGGVAASLIDVAGAGAALTMIDVGQTLLTVDLQLRYLAPIGENTETIIAEGRVRHHDQRRVVAESTIYVDDRVVAIGSVAVIRKVGKAG